MNYDDLEEYLDTSWINDVRKEEEDFDKFYVAVVKNVNIIFVLVNEGKIEDVNMNSCELDDNSSLNWESMMSLSEPFLRKGYIISNILKYSVRATPEDVLSGDMNDELIKWEELEPSCDINFEPTVRFMHDICCLCFIMDKKVSLRKNKTTRRVYLDLEKKVGRSVTRKRYMK